MSAQGKYINDPAVLLEAAKAAGVDHPEKVLQDVSVARDEVNSIIRINHSLSSRAYGNAGLCMGRARASICRHLLKVVLVVVALV